MRTAALLLAVAALTACAASPAKTMTPLEVARLTDVQLCELDIYYRDEPKTMQEIGRRGLSCDPDVVTCMKRGIAQGSPMMPLCVASVQAQYNAEMLMAREQAREDWRTYELGQTESANSTVNIYQ